MLEHTGKLSPDPEPMGCGRGKCSALTCTMDVLSMLKHSIISDDINPIMRDFEIGRQIGSAGPEMVWKIFEAVRQDDKKVRIHYLPVFKL